MILGHYFWFRLPNRPLSLERVRRAWRTNRLDLRHLPEQRKPADVAAEAVTSAAATMLTSTFTQTENSDAHLLYRVEMREGDVAELWFDKQTASFACLNEQILDRVRLLYEQNSTRLPAHKQRQAFRALLLAGGAEYLNPVYFMPVNEIIRDPKALLHRTCDIVQVLYGESAVFHCVPVENSPDQVAYLKAAIDRLLDLEITGLNNEVQRMLEDENPRKWRSDKVEGIVRCKRALEARGDRFADLLGGPGARTFQSATLLDNAVTELLTVTKGPVIA
jgi:hypothetical protein